MAGLRPAKHILEVLALGIIMAAVLVACSSAASTPQTVNGIVLPYPDDGRQYRMSEVCQHVLAEGYDVRGTLHHTIEPDDLEGLLDLILALVRSQVESYLGDAVMVELEIRSLCEALNAS